MLNKYVLRSAEEIWILDHFALYISHVLQGNQQNLRKIRQKHHSEHKLIFYLQ